MTGSVIFQLFGGYIAISGDGCISLELSLFSFSPDAIRSFSPAGCLQICIFHGIWRELQILCCERKTDMYRLRYHIAMKFAVVDDDINYRDIFELAVAKTSLTDTFSFFSNPGQFLKAAGQYDAVFLDIQMPYAFSDGQILKSDQKTRTFGFEIAHRLRQICPHIPVVFLTSYPELVFDAFGLNVIAFIDKKDLTERLPDVIYRIISEKTAESSIAVEIISSTRTVRIPLRSIVYCEVNNRDVFIHTADAEELQIRKHTLGSLYELIDADQLYLFASRSLFVNLHYIARIDGRKLYLKGLRNPVPVARDRFDEINKAFVRYHSV